MIDQVPLRRKAAAECQKALTKLEKAKEDWKRFQQEDVATFARWTAATFGSLLSQKRELEAAVYAKEMLMHEVEEEMYFRGTRSYHSAYANVMRRRERPDPPGPAGAPPEFEADQPPEPDFDEAPPQDPPPIPFDQLSDEEQRKVFDQLLIDGMGIHPKHIPKAQYNQLFAAFRKQALQDAKAASKASSPPPSRGQKAAPKTEDPTESRVKELYRLLVRRLHPDMRADGDPEVSAIWHEVQEAYRTRNVERLETLLALSELQADAFGEGTSLSQMRAVLTELRRSYNALNRNLKAAKQDPAWNFAHRPDRAMLERRMTRDLKLIIEDLQLHLSELEAQIAKWAKPQGKRGRKNPTGQQMDLW